MLNFFGGWCFFCERCSQINLFSDITVTRLNQSCQFPYYLTKFMDCHSSTTSTFEILYVNDVY